MKRSKLTRKTPLKKSLRRLRPSKLKQVSSDRAKWNQLYREQCQRDAPFQRCAKTGQMLHKDLLERHHVAGRLKNRILIYCYIISEFHRWCEDNSKEARILGWIRNERASYPKDDSQPRPWIKGTLINEHLL